MKTKICTKCSIEKPLSEFSKTNHHKDGRASQCKECRKRYYILNKEIFKIRRKQFKQLPNKFCLDCGKQLNDKRSIRCYSCSSKFKIKNFGGFFGKNNPMFGKHHSKLTIIKQSLAKINKYIGINNPNYKNGKPKCIDCDNDLKDYKKGIKRCRPCHNKFYIGKNNPNWQNGISKLPYSFDFTPELKHKIRTCDNFICQCCGMTEEEHVKKYKRCLTIHHINYNKQNCNKLNLITVCTSCNIKANGERDYWYAYYKYIIDNKLYKEKI